MADWSLLPMDLVLRVADCLLADDDLDCYMDFRAVCRHWRLSTADPKAYCTDPRFQPKMWAVLCYGLRGNNCVVSFLNLRTNRFLCKKIPLLRNYHFFTATNGGLLVLGERGAPPYRACVLNPFTGSMVYFTVPIFAEEVRAAAVTTSPMKLFVSNLRNFVGWAELNSEGFQEYRVRYPDYLAGMTLVAGDVYVANRHGSIVSAANVVIADEGTQGRTAMITVTTTIHSAASWVEDGPSYYLLESAGDLLLVTRLTGAGQVVAVHKVDTVRNMLEPVTSIGGRAIFVSQARSFSVNADRFPTVEAGCIYFVPTLASFIKHGIIASLLRLADQRQEDIMELGSLGLNFGPPTLLEVLADYCRFTTVCELEYYYGWDWDDDSKGSELDGSIELDD